MRRLAVLLLVLAPPLAACAPGSTSAAPGIRILEQRDGSAADAADIDTGNDAKDATITLAIDGGGDDARDTGVPPGEDGGTPVGPPPATGVLCRPCTSAATCGGGTNHCLQSASGETFCGIDCGAGCPGGYACQPIGDGAGHVVAMQCVPSSGTCGSVPPPPPPPPPGEPHPCLPCADDATCGGGLNRCLQNTAGETFCGVDCSSGTACPADYECAGIGDGAGHLVGEQCVPVSGSCMPPAPDAGSDAGSDAGTDTGGPPPIDAGTDAGDAMDADVPTMVDATMTMPPP